MLRGVIAHRGAPRLHRDNTLPGILAAARLGAVAVEVDVRATADGVPVLHHDPSLSWWRRRATALEVLPLAAVQARAPHVPTLAEALAALAPSGVPLVLDLGGVRTARACLDVLDATCPDRDAVRRRAWFCGAADALTWLRAADDGLGLLLSWDARRPPSPPVVDAVAPTMVNPQHGAVTPAVVDGWHARGVGVCTWTVDRPAVRERLFGWGVDAVISNDVARAVREHARAGP